MDIDQQHLDGQLLYARDSSVVHSGDRARMARSASDATRFTPSHPHVASKPYPRPSFISIPDTRPENETPQQKVARLRAAAASARSGQESQFDRIVLVGRKWADRAHRVTTLSLIGLSVVCGVFSAYAIGDMLMHNRRKRNEWLTQKQNETARLTEEARRALAAGHASGEQMLLLNRERAANEADARGRTAPVERDAGGHDAVKIQQHQQQPGIEASAAHELPTSGKRPELAGGMLDQQAAAMTSEGLNWINWLQSR